MTPEDAERLLAAAGIATTATRIVRTAEDAVAAAATIGYPVVLKAVGRTLLHKTEQNAVRLNLADERAVRTVATQFEAQFQDDMTGMIVQRMVPAGVEMLVGAVHDPTFGPVIACGSGGVLVELLADTAFRLQSGRHQIVRKLIDELKGVQLLRGHRGAKAADEASLRETILRVSALVAVCPEIQEIDLNPVKVLRTGVRVIDARIRVERQAPVTRPRRVEY